MLYFLYAAPLISRVAAPLVRREKGLAMKTKLLGVVVLLASAFNLALATARITNASDLPLLQDGSARTAFVSGAYETCMEGQRKLPKNASYTAPELGQYCLCYGRALADIVNATELETMAVEKQIPASFFEKAAISDELCRTSMRPLDQGTARKREIVKLENECSKTYFPEDTDYAASVVRNKYCICLASKTFDLATRDKQIGDDLARYGSTGQTPPPATMNAVKEIIHSCSEQISH